MKIFIERIESSINDKGKYGNLLIFTLVLIGLTVIFSYGVGNVSAVTVTPGDIIYVNGSGGHDTNDGSSWLLAKQSIKNATGTVNVNGTIKIANGKYKGVNNSNVTIEKNMNIYGQSKAGTIINGTGTNWIFNIPSGINVTITNLTLTNGTANYGGAIYNTGTLTVTNSNFTSNTAPDDAGGAIFNEGTLNVTDSTFTGNTAPDNTGGAIYNAGVLTVTGSSFTNNTATNYGGAICNEGVLTVTNSNFTGNTATYGGAIYNDGTLTVTNSSFTGNTAITTSGAGGAIVNYYSTLTVTITGSNFTGNTATYGGAIYNLKNLNATNSTFIGNKATGYGGAIINYVTGTLNVTSSTLTNNKATNGGAIENYGTANVHFSRIVRNTASIGNAIHSGTGTVNSSLNWWGSNNGPSTGDVVGTPVNSWLVLKLSASPTTIGNNAHSTITANLRYDNHGNFAGGSFPNGIPVTFKTNLGTITQASTSNGIAKSTLKSGTKTGTATISAYLDNQKLQTVVKVKDTIPPTVVLTSPTNGTTGFSKTTNIGIKFSEKIKASTNWSKIVVKDKYGQAVHITAWISGTTIFIKTNKRAANSWYTVTIPKASIKDIPGNNLQKLYI